MIFIKNNQNFDKKYLIKLLKNKKKFILKKMAKKNKNDLSKV